MTHNTNAFWAMWGLGQNDGEMGPREPLVLLSGLGEQMGRGGVFRLFRSRKIAVPLGTDRSQRNLFPRLTLTLVSGQFGPESTGIGFVCLLQSS